MCHQVQHCIEPGNKSQEREIGCFYIPQYAFSPGVLLMHGKENATLSYARHNCGLGVGVGEGRNGSGEIFSDARKRRTSSQGRRHHSVRCRTSHGELEGSSDALGSREFSFTDGGLIRIVHAFLRLFAFFQSPCQPNDKRQPRECSHHYCHWNEEGVVITFLDH